ncbi:hypothetical protein [Streptomyces oceani]|uniref:Lipoprotein n=1 Tax=Streptomyces oceani TaxID=1075402 RepID=A0A1E7JRL6_9ACTN|nr:hypothetical protein [Streptomyces oceani]OEU91368.1 hypothetical protein AN216_24805 [Streptomyces oceani]
MPPRSSRDAAQPGRRVLLAGVAGSVGVLGLGSGCSADGSSEEGNSGTARRLRQRAAADSRALLLTYDRTTEAHPDLSEPLAPLRAAVARHSTALADERGPSPDASASPTPDRIPEKRGDALDALADAERRTADSRSRDLLEAPPELARLLASVAAAGAAHSYLLTEQDV